jgi:glycosyltransferase involved in cell wall biosynthesis
VDPTDINAIAEKIIYFLSNPQMRFESGLKSRNKILNYYDSEVKKMNLDFYSGVINA